MDEDQQEDELSDYDSSQDDEETSEPESDYSDYSNRVDLSEDGAYANYREKGGKA